MRLSLGEANPPAGAGASRGLEVRPSDPRPLFSEGGPLALNIRDIAARTAVLVLEGDLDLASAPRLETAVAGLRDGGRRCVVADAERVSFCDAAGLRSLLAAHRTVAAFAIVPSTQIRRVAALAEVELPMFDSLDGALAWAAGSAGETPAG